jgi:hypothetical protein
MNPVRLFTSLTFKATVVILLVARDPEAAGMVWGYLVWETEVQDVAMCAPSAPAFNVRVLSGT